LNRLRKEKSPYLKHAAGQAIDWYPWSDEAFEAARKENKPVFLTSGAVWCHWCHVMSKESFDDAETAKLLNKHYICIKLDRDEKPDIDRRFQNAVAAMGFGGGWPLSVFLTPDKKPFFGGTYFPPEDSFDRPGFKKVLKTMADFYKSKRADIDEVGRKIMDSLRQPPLEKREVEESSVQEAVMEILYRFDTLHGGFGSAPKFPMSGAVEFLIGRFFMTKMESLGFSLRKTLESMAKGGFYDQIGGGFHRYAVDAAWTIPHFEKMADDNAWHLRNYADAYSVFGDSSFRDVAEGTIRFITSVLSDPDGGFFASQDADVTPDDEGGYFTWTDEEFRKVLDEEEYRILSLHFLDDRGSMHHDASKKVLFIARDAREIAKQTGLAEQNVLEIIHKGRQKLLRERDKREVPFIDRTLYTSINGMMISAFLKAYRPLKDEQLKNFALKSLERIKDLHFLGNELYHTEGVRAVLDDYMYFIDALISAYEVTGKTSYMADADKLMELCLKKFWDKNEGGFFDTDTEVLGLRLKTIEDIPHPSANAFSIMLCLKLFHTTGQSEYLACAETSLNAFSTNAKKMGIHTGYYYAALDAYFNMLTMTLQTPLQSELAATALSTFHPYKCIVYREDKESVIPCVGKICYEPITDPARLRDFLNSL
jgi:uncharacterized protein